jgi:hypothetical protein
VLERLPPRRLMPAVARPLELRHHHLFTQRRGRRELIDTGSPLSLPAADLGSAAERVGVRFDRLVGMDELGSAPFLLDLPQRRLLLDAPPARADAFPVDFGLGVPRLRLSLEGRPLDAVLDTGAALSYLPAAVLPDTPPLGSYEDFHPVLASPFRTELHRVEMQIGVRRLTTVAGRLPRILQDALDLFGCRAILGLPVLRRAAMLLDPERGRGAWMAA